MAKLVLLGPQRLQPTIGDVVAELGLEGPIAAITGGWQEREQEDDELAEHLDLRTINLELYRRGEEILDRDPQLQAALRELRTLRRRAQELYRVPLDQALATVRQLAAEPPGELVDEELAAAFEVVRALDARHLDRITRLEEGFRKRWATRRRRAVREQRREIDQILEGCSAVAIAGGHVAVLTDLLRFFSLGDQLVRQTVLAWSAGAMALGRRVVLFHDSPPQGFGNPEVWGPGLGIYKGYLPFPHAKRRLQLGDQRRASILARRFRLEVCVPMDEGDRLDIASGQPNGAPTRRIDPSGEIVEARA